MALKSFKHGMCVEVSDKDHACFGMRGTVVRMRMRDNSAFIRLDNEPPESVRLFPADDERGNHVALFPEQCQEVLP